MKNTLTGKRPAHRARTAASARSACPTSAPERTAQAMAGQDGADSSLFPHTPVTYEDYCASKIQH